MDITVVHSHRGACTCGNPSEHPVASRRTADGVEVELWSSGSLTGYYGVALDGVPVARPRSVEALATALRAGWLVLGEVGLWDRAEVPALYAAAKRVAARDGLPGDLRAAMAAPEVHVPIRWTLLSDDAAGTPARFGHLPRLRWPGLGVWHERGFYEVMTLRHDGAWDTTGFKFRTQRELMLHLVGAGRPS